MFCIRAMIINSLLKSHRNITPSLIYLLPRRQKYDVEKLAKPPQLPEDYEERNEQLKRTISPHLTIYKFEMPSQQSIAHRTTGIMLSTYLTILGLGALVLPNDFAHYISVVNGWELNTYLFSSCKFMIALPFSVHFIGGLKHLVWDVVPVTLKRMENVFIAGYVVFGLGIAVAVALASIKPSPISED